MASYIILINFTQQGVQTIKSFPERFDAASKIIGSMGGSLKSVHYTMGRFDGVALVEAPDDETVTKISLALAARGNIRTETLRAFTADEMRRIASSLP